MNFQILGSLWITFRAGWFPVDDKDQGWWDQAYKRSPIKQIRVKTCIVCLGEVCGCRTLLFVERFSITSSWLQGGSTPDIREIQTETSSMVYLGKFEPFCKLGSIGMYNIFAGFDTTHDELVFEFTLILLETLNLWSGIFIQNIAIQDTGRGSRNWYIMINLARYPISPQVHRLELFTACRLLRKSGTPQFSMSRWLGRLKTGCAGLRTKATSLSQSSFTGTLYLVMRA